MRAPRGDSDYCYALEVLDNFDANFDKLELSRFVSLKRCSLVRNRYGLATLVGESVAQAKADRKVPWKLRKSPSRPSSSTVYPAFQHHAPGSQDYYKELRELRVSNFVLEFEHPEDLTYDWNAASFDLRSQFRRALTALRLLMPSSVRSIGFIEYRYHATAAADGLAGIVRGGIDEGQKTSPQNEATLFAERKARAVIKTLYDAQEKKLPPAVELALRRFIQSASRQGLQDQLIDLVIGLEAIYLPDTNAESGYRLAMRMAAHLCDAPAQRQQCMKKARALYDIRSRIVHGGVEKIETLNKLVGENKIFPSARDAVSFAYRSLLAACRTVLLQLSGGASWENYHENIDAALATGNRFSTN